MQTYGEGSGLAVAVVAAAVMAVEVVKVRITFTNHYPQGCGQGRQSFRVFYSVFGVGDLQVARHEEQVRFLGVQSSGRVHLRLLKKHVGGV